MFDCRPEKNRKERRNYDEILYQAHHVNDFFCQTQTMPNSKNTDKVSIVIKIHNSAKNQQAKSENSVRYRRCLSGFCSNFKSTREKKSRVV